MEYPISYPGFENRQLMVTTDGFWSGAKLLIDGEPAPKGPKRGQFTLRRNDGVEVVAQFRIINFIDPVPQVLIDGIIIPVAAPLKWYQWLWAGLPFVLLIIGGAIGGLLGGLALAVNGRLFRSNLSTLAKYLVTGAISAFAGLVFLVASLLFNLSVSGLIPTTPSEFISKTGNFSIISTVDLKEDVQSTDTLIGKIDIHTFSGHNGNAAYYVSYSDYPQDLIRQSDPEGILDSVRDGMVNSGAGKIVSENKISMSNYPGREFVLEVSQDNQEITLNTRIFLVKNRLYQIMVASNKGEGNATERDDFFKSFKLLNP